MGVSVAIFRGKPLLLSLRDCFTEIMPRLGLQMRDPDMPALASERGVQLAMREQRTRDAYKTCESIDIDALSHGGRIVGRC